MLKPSSLSKGDIIAMDRAYVYYEKFEQMTQREIMYVTKMKKNLKYQIPEDTIIQSEQGVAELRVRLVTFTKVLKGDREPVIHHARISPMWMLKASVYISANQRYGFGSERNHRDLSQEMGDRAPF